MGSLVRPLAVVATLFGSILAAVWATVGIALTPLATVTVLVMGGTGNSLVANGGPASNTDEQVLGYLSSVSSNYLQPATDQWGDSISGYAAVYTPEQFWPEPGHTLKFDESVALGLANLSSCVASVASCPRNTDPAVAALLPTSPTDATVIFGYSQSARIATDYKRSLIDYAAANGWAAVPDVSFVLIGNPDRPNGGILERFVGLSIPYLGVTADGATPTDSGCDANGTNCHLDTVDIAWQYDGYANFPLHPLNLLADVNAVMGILYEHGNYDVGISQPNLDSGAIVDQGQYQDTHYYLIPAKEVPLLAPLDGVLPAPVRAALDVPLRTIIEMGYDRSTSPGQPTPAKWFRFSPVRDAVTVGIAVATGLDNGIALATNNPNNRPLGTTPSGIYGVPEFEFKNLLPKTVTSTTATQHPAVGSAATVSTERKTATSNAALDAPPVVRDAPDAADSVATKPRSTATEGDSAPEAGPARPHRPKPLAKAISDVKHFLAGAGGRSAGTVADTKEGGRKGKGGKSSAASTGPDTAGPDQQSKSAATSGTGAEHRSDG